MRFEKKKEGGNAVRLSNPRSTGEEWGRGEKDGRQEGKGEGEGKEWRKRGLHTLTTFLISGLVAPPVPNVSFALAAGLQALEVAQTKARVDGPPPSPSPPLSSSSSDSEDTDESHLPSAEEPEIPASQSTTARTRPATKGTIPSTETRVGAELYRQMVRRGESVLEAVQSFKCIDAPHNIAVRYEAERVATIMDMLVGTSETPPRSRTAIAQRNLCGPCMV